MITPAGGLLYFPARAEGNIMWWKLHGWISHERYLWRTYRSIRRLDRPQEYSTVLQVLVHVSGNGWWGIHGAETWEIDPQKVARDIEGGLEREIELLQGIAKRIERQIESSLGLAGDLGLPLQEEQ